MPEIDRHPPMKPLDYAVLLALSEGDLHGYAIAKRIAERDIGGIALAPGNLYAVLDRLLAAALIRETAPPEGVDERRRTYRLTALGRRVATAETARLGAVVAAAKALLGRPTRAG